jgi:hypothetical protein
LDKTVERIESVVLTSNNDLGSHRDPSVSIVSRTSIGLTRLITLVPFVKQPKALKRQNAINHLALACLQRRFTKTCAFSTATRTAEISSTSASCIGLAGKVTKVVLGFFQWTKSVQLLTQTLLPIFNLITSTCSLIYQIVSLPLQIRLYREAKAMKQQLESNFEEEGSASLHEVGDRFHNLLLNGPTGKGGVEAVSRALSREEAGSLALMALSGDHTRLGLEKRVDLLHTLTKRAVLTKICSLFLSAALVACSAIMIACPPALLATILAMAISLLAIGVTSYRCVTSKSLQVDNSSLKFLDSLEQRIEESRSTDARCFSLDSHKKTVKKSIEKPFNRRLLPRSKLLREPIRQG